MNSIIVMHDKKSGSILLELLLAFALLFLIITPIIGSMASSGNSQLNIQQRLEAENELTTAAEAVWSIRESGWKNLPTHPGTYHLIKNGELWELASGSAQLENGLTQSIEVEDVYRDNNWLISSSSGVLDPSTKRISVNIEYGDTFAKSITSSFMLTRYLDNEQLEQTTEADFQDGTFDATVGTDTNGGEVILATGGSGNWCLPNQNIVTQYDLPGNGQASVVRALEGKVFTGTDQGSQGQFIELSVNQNSPPGFTLEGTTTGYDTNDIFIDGQYAYVATNNTSRDLVIIDLTTNQEVGYFNDSFWWGTAQGIYVVGNVGYLTIGPNLHTIDLSSKTGSRPQLGSIDLSGQWWNPATGYRLQVVGNHAYVTLDWGSAEMRIVDVTNPRSMVRRGAANVNSKRGKDVYVNSTGTRVYLVTTVSSTQNELFVLNTTSKTSISQISSYDSNGMDPRGISVVTGNKLLLVGLGGEEYQVIDIANENTLTKCGGINVDSGIYGVAAVLEADGDAYSYVVTKDMGAEIKVIEGGPGGQYAQSGEFTSAPIDFQSVSVVNYLQFGNQLIENTSIQYQVAGADPVADSCELAQYVFVGPDGTSSTFFSTEGSAPFSDDAIGYENPARCFKYKAFLSTDDPLSTPQFEDVLINYNP